MPGCCCMLWLYNKVAAQCLVLYTLFSQDIKAQLSPVAHAEQKNLYQCWGSMAGYPKQPTRISKANCLAWGHSTGLKYQRPDSVQRQSQENIGRKKTNSQSVERPGRHDPTSCSVSNFNLCPPQILCKVPRNSLVQSWMTEKYIGS